MRKPFTLLAVLALSLFISRDASAVCGDVTGDLVRTPADALAVLRASVGQNVNLVCTDTTPSRVRFYNDIDCNSGSDVSTLTFDDSDEGYQFQADPGETTSYQTVDDTTIDNVQIDLCGDEYTFDDAFHLAPNHSYTLFLILIDPEVYGEGLAYAILYDEGDPVVDTSATAAWDAAIEPVTILGSVRK